MRKVHELLPIAGGLGVGASTVFIPRSVRLSLSGALVVALGILATVLSGEFRISWDFLAIDIPGTALAASAGRLASKWLVGAPLPARRPRARTQRPS